MMMMMMMMMMMLVAIMITLRRCLHSGPRTPYSEDADNPIVRGRNRTKEIFRLPHMEI